MRWLTCLALPFFLSACGDSAPMDASTSDAPDAAVPDASDDTGTDLGTDAGPPPPTVCSICRRDSDCAPGATCLVLALGERACGAPCSTDDDCAAFGSFHCVPDEPGSPMQCSPTTLTCDVSAPGMTCASGADCAGRFDLCRDPLGTGSMCTSTCRDDADCPRTISRCRTVGGESICIPDAVPSGDRCRALVAAGHATACSSTGTCATGLRCVGAGTQKLCVANVPTGGCPSGTHSMTPPGDTTAVCMPIATDPDDWSSLGADCDCAASDSTSLYARGLAAVGRDVCSQAFPLAIVYLYGTNVSRDPYRLSFTDRIRGHWPAAVRFADGMSHDLDSANVGDVLSNLARYDDLRLSAPVTPTTTPSESLATLVSSTGGVPDATMIDAQLGMLPPGLAANLGGVFAALAAAITARQSALTLVPHGEWAGLYDAPSAMFVAGPAAIDPHFTPFQAALRGDVDVAMMASATRDVLAAIAAANLTSFAGQTASLMIDTPMGKIAIRGAGNDTYDDATWHSTLLLIDLGGNDTYLFPAGATTDADHGVAFVVDVAGMDSYGYDVVASPRDVSPAGGARLPSDRDGRDPDPTPASRSTTSRQGVGRLGIGVLMDLGSEGDHYRSLRMSQGYGALGIGVLYDAAGDDVYEGENTVQGAAVAGIGLLLDLTGTDHYTSYTQSQGYAYVKGVGVLDDQAGNDVYFAPPGDVLYFNPQDPGMSNTSLVQGAGFGRRDDAVEGISMSGGLGVLRDRTGNDTYTAAVFAQGTGYLFGTGMLLDGAGDDDYEAQWYVQGAAAHYAVGILIDDGNGVDSHNLTSRRQNMTLGAGHDFSLGVFLDRGGNDVYHAPNLAIGGGNAAGTGIFGDVSGDDLYESTSDFSCGNASVESPGDTTREMAQTIAIFMDADGTDAPYMRPNVSVTPNDDSMWMQTWNGPGHGELGVGIDDHGAHLGL